MAGFNDVLGSALRAGLTRLGRKRLARVDGNQVVPGLEAQVEILRDRWGVPHIYAQNSRDLYFTQGFVHAQDRLFQMELNRRTAKGTLSELFGAVALDTDRAARTFGFARLGREDWERVTPELNALLQAYADGVNACIRTQPGKLPIEFSLVRYKPEPWSPEDTLALVRLMCWQLSHAWYGEIIRAKLIQAVGEARAAELEVFYPEGNPYSLPEGIEFNQVGPEGALPGVRGPFLQRGLGSNEWAVAGSRTVTGKPYLCNDMHMVLGLPLIWYCNHLEAPGLQATGIGLPGLPLVLAGHNDRIAWGMTLAYTDSEDLFIERFDPQNPTRYEFRGEWLDAEVTEEVIRVKGRKKAHVEKVLKTRHGPVISDAVGFAGGRAALSSMALQACRTLEGWWLLNKASGWDDFVGAMSRIDSPTLSVAYADNEGNIGYWVTGRVPVRAKGSGMVPAPGWTGEYEWTGDVPFDEMPHALNPARGYVLNCNNKIVADDYPYFLGSIWMNGYRAHRLAEMIENRRKLSPDDFRLMQTDVTSVPGRQFVERLHGLTSTDTDVQLALEHLYAWDGKLTAATVGGTIYEVARYVLVRSLLEPGLGKALTDEMIGKAFNPVLLQDHEFFGSDTQAVFRMLDNPGSWWVAQAGGAEAVLLGALKQAVVWLRGELGPDPARWQWGKIHRVTLAHPLGMQKPLDRVFNRGPYPVGGDTDTPWQAAMAPGEPYDNKLWAPSVRHIIDLGDFSRSEFIIPAGQSGQLGSPHYSDLTELWLTGEYRPMLWTRAQVEAELEGKLVLAPG